MRKWIAIATIALAMSAFGGVAIAQQQSAQQQQPQQEEQSGPDRQDKQEPGCELGSRHESSSTNAAAERASVQESEQDTGQEVEGIALEELEWESNPDVEGVESAVAIGDPTDEGLYAAFGRMAQDAVFPAHTHPDARLTTVVSGTMYYGVGEEFDPDKVTAYPAGSVVYTPADTPHFMWAQDGQTVMQEAGYGPSGLEPVEE